MKILLLSLIVAALLISAFLAPIGEDGFRPQVGLTQYHNERLRRPI